MPAEMPEKMGALMAGLGASGYFFPFLKATEVVCGALLLLGVYVPLALVILAPIVLNIMAVHLILDPSGAPMAIVLAALMIYLSFFALPYSNKIRALFQK